MTKEKDIIVKTIKKLEDEILKIAVGSGIPEEGWKSITRIYEELTKEHKKDCNKMHCHLCFVGDSSKW